MVKDWRDRLIEAADADERSDRAISLDAKLGENFVNQLRNSDKQPRVEHVLRLAQTLGISRSRLFLGADTTPEDDAMLELLKSASESDRKDILSILQARRRLRNG